MSFSYDVYVKERDRWFLEREFCWDEREEALEKAQSLTKRHYVQAVKVIRERYDKVSRLMTESTIFDTSGDVMHSAPDGRETRPDRERPPSLADLDIWTEDGNAELQWDHTDSRERADAVAMQPGEGLIRRILSGLLPAIVLGVSLVTQKASFGAGVLPPVL